MARAYVVAYTADADSYQGISVADTEKEALATARRRRLCATSAGLAKGNETLWVTVWDGGSIIESYSVAD